MSQALLVAWDFSRWETWLVCILGFGSAALCVVVFKSLMARPQPTVSVPVEPPKPEQFEAQMADLIQRERRKFVRRAGKGVRLRLEKGAPDQQVFEGRLMDRSLGGLGILLEREVPEETVLFMQPLHAPEDLPWIKVVVVNKRYDGSHWETGCRFEGTPAPKALEYIY